MIYQTAFTPELIELAATAMPNPLSAAVLMATRFLREKIKEAKEAEKEYLNYLDTAVDPESEFERERRGILEKLKTLQTEIVLNVFDRILLRVIWPEFYDQITNTYKAKSDQDLALVRAGVAQIEGALKEYYKKEKDRTSARWSAILVAFIAIFALIALMTWSYWYPQSGPNANTKLPILNIPFLVILWSAIGSFTAILYRFNISGDIELRDPMRWLFTRPLTGIVMGTVAYLTVKVGLLSMVSGDLAELSSEEILWLVAFIGGFSDRFADSILKSLVGRFGGDKNADLVDPIPSSLTTAETPYEFHSPDSRTSQKQPAEQEKLSSRDNQATVSKDTHGHGKPLASVQGLKNNKDRKPIKAREDENGVKEEMPQEVAENSEKENQTAQAK